MSETADSKSVDSSWSLGAQNAEVDYHPLALDNDSPGFWGWVDRFGERMSGWLNPILIKEARQSLKSKQFLITFFLLLVASCIWTVMGVVSNAPDVYYVPTGKSLIMGYYLVLAIPMIGMVPLAAHRSLAAEIDDNTFEMLVLTRLSSGRIVMGKMNSAMLQMLVYFAAIVPCLAFTYLLRGVTLPMIALVIVIAFFTALLVTAFSLLLATLAFNRAGQTIAILIVLAVIVFAEFMSFILCYEAVVFTYVANNEDAYLGIASYVVVGLSFIVLFIQAAAARIAPVTENRSTGLRRTMFVQQLIWIGVMSTLSLWWNDLTGLEICATFLAAYWLLMGALMFCETSELSPRVQRGLPSTFAGRALLTWFNPGPATGYVFAAASGTAGLMAIGVFGGLVQVEGRTPRNSPLVVTCVLMGYLLAFLSLTRMISEPIMRRTGRILPVPLGTAVGLLVLALIMPSIVVFAMTGSSDFNYSPIHAINWIWTLDELFSRSYDPGLAMLILVVGGMFALGNLAVLFKVFGYRRVAVPDRVLEDQAHDS